MSKRRRDVKDTNMSGMLILFLFIVCFLCLMMGVGALGAGVGL